MPVELFIKETEKLGLHLSQPVLEGFARYAELLWEGNQKFNLTTLDSPQAVYEMHFLDSLSAAMVVDLEEIEMVLDVGSGAGFPGLPLALAYPRLQVVLLESIGKKSRFLQEVIAELELGSRVQVLTERAEVLGRKGGYRGSFPLVTARAVARLPVLLELCLPLVKQGGYFVAWKGPSYQEEAEEAASALQLLGGEIRENKLWQLPGGAERALVKVKKTTETPLAYPRRTGIPNKRPL